MYELILKVQSKLKHTTQAEYLFMMLCFLMASFFFLPKSLHRVFYYFLLLSTFWVFRDQLYQRLIDIVKEQKILVVFFVFCVVVSFVHAVGDGVDMLKVVKMAFLVSSFLLVISFILDSIDKWQACFFTYVLSATIIGIGLCAYFYGYEGMWFLNVNDRLWGIGRGVNPNVGGLLYSIAILLSYCSYDRWLFLKRERDYRFIFMVVSVVICSFVVLATQSRGAILALGVTGSIVLVLQKRYAFLGLIYIIVFSLLAGIIYAYGDFSDFFSRGDNSRFDVWKGAFSLFLQSPVFGVGLAADVLYDTPIASWRSAHNIYLGLAVYHGIIGLMLFLVLWGSTFKAAYMAFQDNQDLSIVVIMIYASVFGLFEHHTVFLNLNPEWIIFWLPVAYSIFLQISSEHYVKN